MRIREPWRFLVFGGLGRERGEQLAADGLAEFADPSCGAVSAAVVAGSGGAGVGG